MLTGSKAIVNQFWIQNMADEAILRLVGPVLLLISLELRLIIHSAKFVRRRVMKRLNVGIDSTIMPILLLLKVKLSSTLSPRLQVGVGFLTRVRPITLHPT